MPNYKNGKIYLITSPSTDKVYVGSTVLKLWKRLNGHCSYQSKNCYSREIIELGNAVITLLHDFPCNTKKELLQEEQRVMELYPNKVNKYCAWISEEERKTKDYERNKEWRDDNKEYIALKNTEWREANREYHLQTMREYNEANKVETEAKRSVYYTCDCGKEVQLKHKARHNKTKIHLEHFKTIL